MKAAEAGLWATMITNQIGCGRNEIEGYTTIPLGMGPVLLILRISSTPTGVWLTFNPALIPYPAKPFPPDPLDLTPPNRPRAGECRGCMGVLRLRVICMLDTAIPTLGSPFSRCLWLEGVCAVP